MPTTSAIYAVMLKYDALTAANFPSASRPTIYLDEAPLYDGGQKHPPYTILRDNGQTPTQLDFERTSLEECDFTIEVYYTSLADVGTAINAIRLNGGTPGQGLGFDYGSLPDLTTPRSSYKIERGTIRHRLSGYGLDGKPIYVGSIDYRITIQETP